MNQRHLFRSATYVFLIKEHKVLLARRYNTGYKDGEYSTMAGHIEPGETVGDCAVREVEEESNVTVKKEKLNLFHVMTRFSDFNYIDFFFYCKKWEGEPRIGEPDLCDDMSWFDLDNLPGNTIDYIQHALKCYKNGEMFSKYGWE